MSARNTQPTDRDEQSLEKGDRVRIIRSSEWKELDGKRRRLAGLYGYVTDDSSLTTISVRLEEHQGVVVRVQPHTVALAAFDTEPEVEQSHMAQSSADVQLLERVPYTGRTEYSVYEIGDGEGTATLMYHNMHWELRFVETGDAEYDGGEAGPYDDSPSGAWSAWNLVHAHLKM